MKKISILFIFSLILGLFVSEVSGGRPTFEETSQACGIGCF